MSNLNQFEKFRNLSFDDFKKLAKDDSLSKYQKIGFPDSYREGKEDLIFEDIISKLECKSREKETPGVFFDIGPGCSDLPMMLIDFCEKNNLKLLLSDSAEMLDQIPSKNHVIKFNGYFPDQLTSMINEYQNKIDYIVGYSIFHYVFYNTCIYKFIDSCLSLLKSGGRLFLGDIPNISKRNRFFSSEAGILFHKNFMQDGSVPDVKHLTLDPMQIDDGLLMGIVQRYRGFGYEAFLLPQPPSLPFSNRREDLLIIKY